MNIAITVWGNRVSPVFDAAQTLLVVEIKDDEIVDKRIRAFQAARFDRFQQIIRENEVKILICGAICELGLRRLEAVGVEVVPFLTGEVDGLIDQFVRGEEFTEFAMPGCRIGGCCRSRREAARTQERLRAGEEG